MAQVLVIGAGGVGSVAVHKMAMNADIFTGIALASRTKSKCDAIAASVKERTGVDVATYQIDADDVAATTALINQVKPMLVVNLALPYQDLTIMDACLAAGVHYMDTANYEPREEAKFEYKWQWAYQERFKEKGLMALLGSGFDPGVTSVFAGWLKKHKLDTIRTLDILDCNGGDHGQAFATNFNPEINIREVTAPARHWLNGEWVETPALTIRQQFDFEAVGPKNMYLMYHEEIESLKTHLPEIERIRFWMTFGDAYITHLTVLQNVGMTRIDPVVYEGKEIIPLQFLKAVLPEPASLGATTKGKTNIGDIATGTKDGVEKTFYIYNICDHEDAFAETGNQAISYTTGVPAMIGAALMVQGLWKGEGVFNIEQLDPDPFMDMLNQHGLPWQVKELAGPLQF
ncbi:MULTISPECIES: saccharopine dehydrogenase family protein [unclassified Novosphingobium]|uniref:saccharopine dehydrogenase family protein n=1 Tax=unclassified Novosphingobium TaxID=2644732 RepID=UPI0003B77674|nr:MULTISPECIES: saccharopine dehydrogenase family protein [unclassified Novosphingobium]KPF55544.1 saccharopine dehydrogenase [Novosphingobium sp. AAP1]MBB3357750.1 saccharopine dehydrogenase (NAD+, L-lysine-forming) [Novosphingobium sp. BK256]MBB3373586.1 saccharopine dehydrogenase (NAD+, L-lysine-forming) [Novosphingobium sp. BK280]MBB3377998.1 saccharopine dehydrogenase (NAD+, L-lysine-forming) [Novosphingobium sp. BK258]MBB3420217.1 saccharopine dehydrogenase (NAD+, L-lysine-forming) [Nov